MAEEKWNIYTEHLLDVILGIRIDALTIFYIAEKN